MSWSSLIRRGAATGAVAFVLSATIATGAPAASVPLVTEQCDSTVRGQPGQRVHLEPSAVQPLLIDALRPLDPLDAIRPRFREAWRAEHPVLIGAILDGRSVISGPIIADAVVHRVDTISPLEPVFDALQESAWTAIAAACSVVTEPDSDDPPSSSRPPDDEQGDEPGETKRPADPGGDGHDPDRSRGGAGQENGPSGSTRAESQGVAPEQPLLSGDLMLGGSGVSPEGIPFDFRHPEVGSVPEFGIVGNDSRSGMGTGNSPGSATPLSMEDEHRGPDLPVLLAVVFLATVTAQLLRTWVLRRTQ